MSLSNLHDARILRTTFDGKDRRIQLDGVCVDGRSFALSIADVLDVCASNLRIQNVILSAEVFCDPSGLEQEQRESLAQSTTAARVEEYFRQLARANAQLMDVNYSCRSAPTILAGGHQVHRSLG